MMCYADDVVMATAALTDYIDQIEEVLVIMKKTGLNCKSPKREIFRDLNEAPGQDSR